MGAGGSRFDAGGGKYVVAASQVQMELWVVTRSKLIRVGIERPAMCADLQSAVAPALLRGGVLMGRYLGRRALQDGTLASASLLDASTRGVGCLDGARTAFKVGTPRNKT